MTVPVTPDLRLSAVIAASFVALSFGGVDGFHLMMGSASYVVGSWGRSAGKVAAALEAEPPQKYGRYIASASAAPFLGAMCSLMLFLAAHMAKFEGDAAIALILAVGGYRGPEGIQMVVSLVSGLIPKSLGGGGAKQEGKP